MSVRETDISTIDNSELVEDQLLGLAGGILDLLDDTNPDSSGVAQMAPKEEVVVEEEAEEVEEVVSEEEPSPAEEVKPQMYKIKHEGSEKEVSHDELLELAQKGFDYTKKTQKLAEERNELSPYIGLAKKIQSDPLVAAKIAELLNGKPVEVEPPRPKSDDPVENLKWEIKQELRKEMEEKMRSTIAPMNKQQALDRVRMQVQADPMFHEVQQDIMQMVQNQPKALQRNLYLQLDQDPEAYMQAFEHFKQIRRSSNPVVEPPKQAPKPVATKTKAPILEAGGVAQPEQINAKAKREVLSKQKSKALRSGDTSELAKWLVDSGSLEHLY